ncbi:MAG TPA: 2-C-methyl-D-erythritol 4-phosphate cytidylyltransferase [Eoetvoesiella sp.]
MTKKIIAIVPAAGVGQRAQTDQILPKQYRLLKGEPMLRWAVKALLADNRIEQVRVAVAPHDDRAAGALAGLPRTVWRPCGGPSRAATVMAALQDAQLSIDDWVLVHDAARPGLPGEALRRLIDACLSGGVGGLLAQEVPDTVKKGIRVEPNDAPGGCLLTGNARQDAAYAVEATLDRQALWLAQTPQMFPAARLLAALQAAGACNAAITDEASAMELTGYMPRLVAGSVRNFKVTWPDDFQLMEKWL